MREKWQVVLMVLCCMTFIVAKPLTVSAAFPSEMEEMPADGYNDWGELMEDMSDIGYANDMAIFLCLFDGKEEKITKIGDLDKMNVFSAQLESEHFYQASLKFICTIDQSNLEKYEDVNLQVRFPATLAKGSPNAISYAVNGKAIDTWYETFGISSEEDVDLYYLKGSGVVNLIHKKADFLDRTADDLFASAKGFSIGEVFREAMENSLTMDGYQVVLFEIKFILYAAPHKGAFHYEDLALDYYAGQKLTYAIKPTTSAPESYFYTATMRANGSVQLSRDGSKSKPSSIMGTSEESAIATAASLLVGVLICVAIYLLLSNKGTQQSGKHGIVDKFLHYMKLVDSDDDDDDYYDEVEDEDI